MDNRITTLEIAEFELQILVGQVEVLQRIIKTLKKEIENNEIRNLCK